MLFLTLTTNWLILGGFSKLGVKNCYVGKIAVFWLIVHALLHPMVIGILERFLILTAVLAGSPAGVGLVVAAKSVFRFEDAKKGRHNAEYFLIGTFLSVTEAVIGGVVVQQLLGFMSRSG